MNKELESGYILTELGRTRGYINLLKESEIDDAVRGTFAILRGEGIPCTPNYISELTRLSKWAVEGALRKLLRADLVEEIS